MKLSLLDVPSDTSLFPNGFPKGMHPVRADISYNDDIRMSALQIDGALLNAGIFAQYVSKDGSKSPLAVSLDSYIAGENGPLPNGLVPAAASLLLFGGYPLRLGQFVPQSAAYQSENGGKFSAQCKWAVAPNSVSGPGVYVEAADMEFETVAQSASMYTAKAFQYIKNQPILLPSGKCQRNINYYNNATAMPLFRRGQVTLGKCHCFIAKSSVWMLTSICRPWRRWVRNDERRSYESEPRRKRCICQRRWVFCLYTSRRVQG